MQQKEIITTINFGRWYFKGLEFSYEIKSNGKKHINLIYIKPEGKKIDFGTIDIETLEFVEFPQHPEIPSILSVSEVKNEFVRCLFETKREEISYYEDLCRLWEIINRDSIKRSENSETEVKFSFNVELKSSKKISDDFLHEVNSKIYDLIYDALSVEDADATEIFDFEECNILRNVFSTKITSAVEILK